MLDFNGNKGFRLLGIYEKLNRGESINKANIASYYNVTEKTIQRDIDDLRVYLSETYQYEDKIAIKYDKSKNVYNLIRSQREWITNQEVLTICKIILESRAFNKNELDVLINKLLNQVTPTSREIAKTMILNEKHNYVPLLHGKDLIVFIWELSEFICKQEIVEISYTRKDGLSRKHLVKPVAIMFSEYYFYLIVFMADGTKDYPTVFRVDRIEEFKGMKEKFHIPYSEKFSDSEFRDRVPFMFTGELHTVTFEFYGVSVEYVLDRFPTAQIISKSDDGTYTIKVEVYGSGIDIWIRSQGDLVKVVN